MRVLVAAALLLAACGPAVAPTPAPSPLPVAELRYRVMDAAGRPWFCDRDFYPIARQDERELALQRFAEVQADGATFAVMLVHLGIAPAAGYTDDQKLALYREWKTLNALRLDPAGDTYAFAYLAQRSDKTGEQVAGRVTASGRVSVTSRAAAGPPNCPICLARGTRIATPGGGVAVEDLRVGDVVWTAGVDGDRVAAPLVAVGSTPVPPTHEVVRLALDDGRVVLVSPGHPTADGRRVGDLRPGDVLDGARVAGTQRLTYGGGATFDVLPAGATGAYWADGVLLGSTLRAP